MTLIEIIVCIIASFGAGVGTGFAGMSAAAVIAPMLVSFLDIPAYQAIGIALASDVIASLISAIVYGKHKNLDIKNGFVLMIVILIFTVIGSKVSTYVPDTGLGWLTIIGDVLLGLKFIIWPSTKPRKSLTEQSKTKRILKEVALGIYIGFVCGFMGAGGGMMMLLGLTVILGYDLKTAVGTSVFIMTFTALTGSVTHFVIGGVYSYWILILCVVLTCLFAQLSSIIANKLDPLVQNRTVGALLVVLGVVMIIFKII